MLRGREAWPEGRENREWDILARATARYSYSRDGALLLREALDQRTT